MSFTASQIKSANNATLAQPAPTAKFDPNGSTMQTLLPSSSGGYLSRVSSDISSGAQDAVGSEEASIEGTENPILSGLDIAKSLTGAVASPITEALKPILDSTGLTKLSDFIGKSSQNLPGMSQFTDTLSKHPEVVQGLSDAVNTFMNLAQIEGGISGGEKIVDSTQDAVSSIKNKVNGESSAVPKITPEEQALNDAKANATQAEAQASQASTESDVASKKGVTNLQEMQGSVSDYKNDLGSSFRKGAEDIQKNNPNVKLILTNDQVDALNQLKNNKSFALPEYLRNVTPENVEDIDSGVVKLSPTQAQDLITQLNKSTFTERASGLAVDQSKIGLTNEIKAAASQAFGEPWKNVYSQYSQGVNAIEKISDVVNIDKDATATDINKSLKSVLNLSKTSAGRVILQNALEEFKNVSGYDLTKPIESIQQIADAEEKAGESQSELKARQKDVAKAQEEVDKMNKEKLTTPQKVARLLKVRGGQWANYALRFILIREVYKMITTKSN